jgi:glycosyltransferase involved in cell wall biosynthesis
MRVAVDARELTGRPTGVGRYLAGLLREWAAARPAAHEVVLYAHEPVAGTPGIDVRIVPGSGGTFWEQRDLAAAVAADRADVLFSPAYSTPIATRVPRVVALHDLSFIAHPEWFGWREGLRRRTLARWSASAARAIVTISEFSKSEIVSRVGVAPAKVHVIPPGIDAPPRPADAGAERTGDHILYVGSIFNRRHVPDLIAAFVRLTRRHRDAFLHLVGDNRSQPHQAIGALIQASGASERIRWHDYVDDEALHVLYHQAQAFVFLSEYEGLGLTPLEALAAGVPPLLLDTPVARESCGEAAMYVGLSGPDQLAAALEQVLYDRPTRQTLLAHADSVLARYDWAAAARDTMRVLEGAV